MGDLGYEIRDGGYGMWDAGCGMWNIEHALRWRAAGAVVPVGRRSPGGCLRHAVAGGLMIGQAWRPWCQTRGRRFLSGEQRVGDGAMRSLMVGPAIVLLAAAALCMWSGY